MIVVVVAVLVVVAVVSLKDGTDEEAEKERCKKVLESCIQKCTKEAIPSGELSGDRFFKCRKECLEAADCWGVRLY